MQHEEAKGNAEQTEAGSSLAEGGETKYSRFNRWRMEKLGRKPSGPIQEDKELDEAVAKIRDIRVKYRALYTDFCQHKKAMEVLQTNEKEMERFFMEEGVREKGLTGVALRTMGDALKTLHCHQQELMPLYNRVDGTWKTFDVKAIEDALDSVKQAEYARSQLETSKMRLEDQGSSRRSLPRRKSAEQAVVRGQEEYNRLKQTVLVKASMLDVQRGEMLKRDLYDLSKAMVKYGTATAQSLEILVGKYNEALTESTKPEGSVEDVRLLRRISTLPNPSVSV